MESIRAAKMHGISQHVRKKVRRAIGIAQRRVRGDVRIAQGRQGKHEQQERQEACIAGYVRRELIT